MFALDWALRKKKRRRNPSSDAFKGGSTVLGQVEDLHFHRQFARLDTDAVRGESLVALSPH
jgi:hypothetical protein